MSGVTNLRRKLVAPRGRQENVSDHIRPLMFHLNGVQLLPIVDASSSWNQFSEFTYR